MPQSNLPILVVEDSPEDFEALVRVFTKAGVRNPIYRFSYGEDALDFLKLDQSFADVLQVTRGARPILDGRATNNAALDDWAAGSVVIETRP